MITVIIVNLQLQICANNILSVVFQELFFKNPRIDSNAQNLWQFKLLFLYSIS